MNIDRLAIIKKAAQKAEAKRRGITFEEIEMQDIIKTLDKRKVQVKAEEKARRKEERKVAKDLTGQVKKAGHLSKGGLDFNRAENMFYSDKDTKAFIENSSYFENYQNTRDKDWD